jgi:dipeptidyl aminopeptidase/acylaminoacyl peptidase
LELCVRIRRWIFKLAGLCLALWALATETSAQSVQGAEFDPTPVNLDQTESKNARPVTSMDLLTLRDPKGLSISPDGKYVAFVVGQAVDAANGYRSGLFLVATGGNHSVRSLGTAGMPHWDGINQWIPEAPQWSPDSNVIWYRARMHAGERWQVWGWNLQSGRRQQVTRLGGDVESYRRIQDGHALFLTVVSPREAGTKPKSGESGILFSGQFRPYQSIPVLTQLESAEEPRRECWIHDLQTGRERRATEKEIHGWRIGTTTAGKDSTSEESRELAKYHVVDAQVSPNQANVAYLYVVDDPSLSRTWSRRLLLRSTRTHSLREVTPDAYFVDQLWWSADGAELYFTERDGRGHAPQLWKVSADDSKVQLLFNCAGSDYFSSFSPDKTGRYLACLRENNTSPPQVTFIDTVSHQVGTLVDLNPGFKSLRRSPAERIEGTNRFDERWFGYFVKPLGYEPGTRYPLIVTTYRSGDYFLRGGSGDENPIQVYAANGFAVLSFDVGVIRNLRPGHFEEKIQDWASPTASLEAAIQQLSDRGLIDPARVGIAGFSHGEEIAGYAVTHTSLFHAAIGAAFYDPCFYFLGGTEWWNLFERWGLGGWPEGKSKSNWQQIAMSTNADRIRTPILENASDSEYLIYLPVYRSLQDLDKPVELYLYPNELHVRNQPRHRLEIYERNLDWFLFWLKDEERPGSEKSEQYRRWRQLRVQSAGSSHSGLTGPGITIGGLQ